MHRWTFFTTGHNRDTIGIWTQVDRHTNGQGHRRTGTETQTDRERDRDTDEQGSDRNRDTFGQGHRRTGKGTQEFYTDFENANLP
jgi:hypothetical protein